MNKTFENFIKKINSLSASKSIKFSDAGCKIKEFLEKISKKELIEIVKEIGTIPEEIEPSSSAEKLFSKASDYVLARCFVEMNLKSHALNERSNSADIIAQSEHNYSLVADAKTFRLSRTAKNQKDFKISTLSNWRGSEHDFAVLVAPYFQYPKTSSQIYSCALDEQVCLFSWEHILFLLINDVKEDDSLNLENIWNAPVRIAREKRILYKNRMDCQLENLNEFVCKRIGKTPQDFCNLLQSCKQNIVERAEKELKFLNEEKKSVENLTREEAIFELLKSKKITEKISTIKKFINSFSKGKNYE